MPVSDLRACFSHFARLAPPGDLDKGPSSKANKWDVLAEFLKAFFFFGGFKHTSSHRGPSPWSCSEFQAPPVPLHTRDSRAAGYLLEVDDLFVLSIQTSCNAASTRALPTTCRVLRNQLRKTAWGSRWNLLFCHCSDTKCAILYKRGQW